MSFDLVLEVDGDRDKVSMAGTVTLVKPVPEETGPDVEETAWWAGNIIFLLIGLGVVGAVLLVSARIFASASAPMEEMSSLADYEMTVDGSGWDDSAGIPQAPSLPSDDEVANSMYGGAKEIFEQPAEMPPPPLPEPEPAPEPEPELPPGVPSIPDEGLPEGWTVEQWIHYGQRWLDQQNRD